MNTLAFRPLVALSLSFAVTSLIGVGSLLLYWGEQDLARAGMRSCVFMALMGCVHLAGYVLYVRQNPQRPTEAVPRAAAIKFSPTYQSALGDAIVLQAALAFLSGMMLDGGRLWGFFWVAFLGHWIAISIILRRRPSSPTRADVLFIRFGIVPLMVLASALAPAVWALLGESELSGVQRLLGDLRYVLSE